MKERTGVRGTVFVLGLVLLVTGFSVIVDSSRFNDEIKWEYRDFDSEGAEEYDVDMLPSEILDIDCHGKRPYDFGCDIWYGNQFHKTIMETKDLPLSEVNHIRMFVQEKGVHESLIKAYINYDHKVVIYDGRDLLPKNDDSRLEGLYDKRRDYRSNGKIISADDRSYTMWSFTKCCSEEFRDEEKIDSGWSVIFILRPPLDFSAKGHMKHRY